ncbi:MAG TPA: hypothetical protein VFD01_17070 [Candidatus Dormibacteraeota bacterium]|nr:hypothetical protein [Candidatus Dormibacteraeota bacterium]
MAANWIDTLRARRDAAEAAGVGSDTPGTFTPAAPDPGYGEEDRPALREAPAPADEARRPEWDPTTRTWREPR